ncbi:MAG: ATP-binding protein [Pseudomonadota bacterium]
MSLKSVNVPKEMEPIFEKAENVVSAYFDNKKENPHEGTIEILDSRYVMVRGAALSVEFFELVNDIFGKGREHEAESFAKNLLFDLAHAVGKADAKNFCTKMGLKDPIEKLSAGPVNFAYTGWARVDIFPESHPSPDENYFLIYDHPYSFESDAWLKQDHKSDTPVCIMNAGYSSGWCEESFGFNLVACEILCRAKGDDCCRFIMAPPEKIETHIHRYMEEEPHLAKKMTGFEIPDFFSRKKMEEELRQAKDKLEIINEKLKVFDQKKSDFVSAVAHELRGPLATIRGGISLVLEGIHGDINEKQRKALDISKANIDRLVRIVNNLLDLSKMEMGKMEMHWQSVDLNEIIRHIILSNKQAIEERKLDLRESLPDMPVRIDIDPDMITQVITNLLTNAIKYTDAGYIEIKLVDMENKIECSVSDSGIGIADEDLPNVFDKFMQFGRPDDRRQKGTGLGLSIAKGLVELHHGRIWLTSELGRGTTFTFMLPKEMRTS